MRNPPNALRIKPGKQKPGIAIANVELILRR